MSDENEIIGLRFFTSLLSVQNDKVLYFRKGLAGGSAACKPLPPKHLQRHFHSERSRRISQFNLTTAI